MNLQQRYNREDFLAFLKTFVPNFKADVRRVNGNNLQVTEEIYSLGSCVDLDLEIFELTHSSSADARVALSMDGFRIMKNSATYRALVVYRSENGDDWRFSLMTATPSANEKGKVVQSLSNPRRFSFFLGPNAKVNTPYQFLIKQGAVKDFEDLQKRFSLEVVNKEFYKAISEKFTKLVGGTLNTGKKKKTYEPLLKLPSIAEKSQVCLEFGVRLIGRIIFCWFLKEKIGSNGTALMPKELLSLDAVTQRNGYYHGVLESIFFEVLNKEAKSRLEPFSNEPFSSIPYLNGGLFSPHEDDYYRRRNGEQSLYHNTLAVPDEWFIDFFKVLETYNFTIDENTSFDEELSIEPEMLGRIFENLLAEINPETGTSVRNSTGSFYTPRPIVDYMVDESLYHYLRQQTNIEENKLHAIISYDLIDDAEHPLDDTEKQKIIDSLSRLKLLDPACGSGAFPIGALQKIVFILQQIDKDGHLWLKTQLKSAPPEIRRVIEREFAHKNFDYIRKLGVIRENIYGVDIQPIATEISRLRCFLTLVVDERVDDSLENRGIEPLPNLDFKFVTANSLIPLPSGEQTTLFKDRAGIEQLQDLRNQFFNATNHERLQLKNEFKEIQKQMLLRMIENNGGDELTQKLSAWDPFSNKATTWFDPEWMFGNIDGFDVVIGNPPYGILNKKQNKAESIIVSPEEAEFYKNSTYYEPATGGMLNIFRLFILRSIKLLNKDGVFSEIFPLAFMCDLSISKLRKYILENNQIICIEAFPERDDPNKRVFEAAKMSVCILNLKKKNSNDSFFIRINTDRYIDTDAEKNYLTREAIDVLDKQGCTFPLISSAELNLLLRIFSNSIRFSALGTCNTGEVDMTFCKECFTKSSNDVKLLKGAIIDRYQLRAKMSQGEIVYINEKKLFSLKQNLPRDFKANERIVLQGITGVNESSRLKMMIVKDAYCANSLNYLTLKQEINLNYLLGIFNSKLLNFIFSKFSTNSNVNGYEVDNLPIVMNDAFVQPIGAIVDKILKITSATNYLDDSQMQAQVKEYEKQIDQMVYELYGLKPDEIAIVKKEESAKIVQ